LSQRGDERCEFPVKLELKSLSELGAERKVSLLACCVKAKRARKGIKVVPRTSVLDGGFSFFGRKEKK
jgi:hypothetical protein